MLDVLTAENQQLRSNGDLQFMQLPEVEDGTICENDRNKFLNSIEKKK